MTATLSSDSTALVQILERQKSLYEQLRGLSEQQAGCILRGQSESLLSLLGQRQKLIDDATTLNNELEGYRQRWPVIWAGLGDDDRQRVGDLVRQVQDQLGAIVQQDERDRQSLLAAKGRVSQELQKVTRGTTANNAYRATSPAASNTNRFTNRQG